MKDRRRITLTSYQLVNIQRALETRIEVCLFRVGTAKERGRLELWATECAHCISAYRRTYAYPSGEAKSSQIADRYLQKLRSKVEEWGKRHGG